MTNSDNGNRHAHQPGDRVRIRHNPRHDHSYSVEQNRARQALAGQIGSIRERTVTNAYRVAPPGLSERGAWFEADELEPPLPPVGSRVRVKAGLHEGRVLVVKQHRGGEVLAEQGPRMGWYDPSEVEPWGKLEPVGGPTSPPVDRPVPELRAGVLASFDALEAKLGTALQEAQGWHSAALLARGEAEGTRERLAEVEAELDALRGKLGAAEAMLRAEEGSRVAWRNEALREQGERKAAEVKLAAVAEAWGRAFLLALPRPLGAAGLATLDAVDQALGGAATEPAEQKAKIAKPWQDGRQGLRWRPRGDDPTRGAATVGPSGWTSFASPPAGGSEGGPDGEAAADRALLAAGWTLESEAKPERECCWEQTVEQRMAALETRLGRLEEHAPRCGKPTPDGWSCTLMAGHAHPDDHHSGRP